MKGTCQGMLFHECQIGKHVPRSPVCSIKKLPKKESCSQKQSINAAQQLLEIKKVVTKI